MFICDKKDFESLCWKGNCEKCKGGLKLIKSITRGDHEMVVYRNWVKNVIKD